MTDTASHHLCLYSHINLSRLGRVFRHVFLSVYVASQTDLLAAESLLFQIPGLSPVLMSAESQAKPFAGSHDPSLHDTATATKDTGELATEKLGSVFKTSLRLDRLDK